jgi:DHA2 family multidrug resistance protein
MWLASRLGMRVDQRKIMAFGLLVLAGALYQMSTWTPDVPEGQMMLTLIVQGFSVGLVFNPMSVMAYTTLSPQLRGEGTAMQSLARNFGSAVGISVTSFTLTRNVQATHADIAAGITPFNRVLQMGDYASHMLDPLTKRGAALLNGMINQQAEIIAYNNDFRMMILSIVPPLLLLLLMRRHVQPGTAQAGDD